MFCRFPKAWLLIIQGVPGGKGTFINPAIHGRRWQRHERYPGSKNVHDTSSNFGSTSFNFESTSSNFESTSSNFGSTSSNFESTSSNFESNYILQLWKYILQLWKYILQLWKYILQLWKYILHIWKYILQLWKYILQLWMYILQLWKYILQLWTYILQLWKYILQLWKYILQLWMYILQLWKYILQLWTYILQLWKYILQLWKYISRFLFPPLSLKKLVGWKRLATMKDSFGKRTLPWLSYQEISPEEVQKGQGFCWRVKGSRFQDIVWNTSCFVRIRLLYCYMCIVYVYCLQSDAFEIMAAFRRDAMICISTSMYVYHWSMVIWVQMPHGNPSCPQKLGVEKANCEGTLVVKKSLSSRYLFRKYLDPQTDPKQTLRRDWSSRKFIYI